MPVNPFWDFFEDDLWIVAPAVTFLDHPDEWNQTTKYVDPVYLLDSYL